MIKLVAFDIDQTLVDADLVVSPRVVRAVRAAVERGVIVTLATGRGPRVTSRFARKLGLASPFVSYQGGMVYDLRLDKVLHETRLPAAAVPRIVDLAEARGFHLHFEESSHIYLPAISDHPDLFYDLIRIAEWSRVADLRMGLPAVPHKFIITLNDPADRELSVAALRADLNGDHGVDIIPSHPYLVEGLPRGIHKAVGLARLCESLGIAPNEVMAVGDNDNDVTMLEWAGLGVAMGNSSPAARLAADVVVPSVSDDGAAVALERYVLR